MLSSILKPKTLAPLILLPGSLLCGINCCQWLYSLPSGSHGTCRATWVRGPKQDLCPDAPLAWAAEGSTVAAGGNMGACKMVTLWPCISPEAVSLGGQLQRSRRARVLVPHLPLPGHLPIPQSLCLLIFQWESASLGGLMRQDKEGCVKGCAGCRMTVISPLQNGAFADVKP